MNFFKRTSVHAPGGILIEELLDSSFFFMHLLYIRPLTLGQHTQAKCIKICNQTRNCDFPVENRVISPQRGSYLQVNNN